MLKIDLTDRYHIDCRLYKLFAFVDLSIFVLLIILRLNMYKSRIQSYVGRYVNIKRTQNCQETNNLFLEVHAEDYITYFGICLKLDTKQPDCRLFLVFIAAI